MKLTRRRLWLFLTLMLVAVIAGLALVPGLPGIVSGYIAGEPFFRDRPLRHWREVLRTQGRNGHIDDETVASFWNGHRALPVLRELTNDADSKVRWPALTLLGQSGLRTQEVLNLFISALSDEDVEVRLHATAVLDGWGPMAKNAVPALVERLNDSVAQVAMFADNALWRIDISAAAKADRWELYQNPEWGFNVMLPGRPEYKEGPVGGAGPGLVHSFTGNHKAGTFEIPTHYTIAVSEYPDEILAGTTEEERLATGRELALMGLGGRLVREVPMEQHGRKGVERLIEVEGKGVLWTRLFASGKRLYQVQVVYKLEFFNEPAAKYFLDSFRLLDAIEKPSDK